MTAQIRLASRSPRRRELLSLLGIRFDVAASDVDERPQPEETAETLVRRLALAKARAALSSSAVPVLAADTVVTVDGHVLGKPRDRDHALAMLSRLSERWHEVFTAVAVATPAMEAGSMTRTRVRFRAITSGEAQAYWASGEPADKAGAYAIQGIGGAFVAEICGSYSGVVGLPLVETLALLARLGVHPPVLHPDARSASVRAL